MRITNGIMQNNALNNVSINKIQINTLDNQLSTQKKISRPSEDPIVAIRALRLRTNLDEVSQYLDKNIPDANSWLDVTEGALNEANDIISDVYKYCVQGSTETLSTKERKVISDALKELRAALYSQGDVDYAGRYIFTGYKTDTSLTFSIQQNLQDADYSITQQFKSTDFEFKTLLQNPTDIDTIKTMTPAQIAGLNDAGVDAVADYTGLSNQTAHSIRLAYSDIKEGAVALKAVPAGSTTGEFEDVTVPMRYTTDCNELPAAGEVLVNTVTGELLFGQDMYNQFFNYQEFSVTYEKDSFMVTDARPEHYFDCTNLKTGIKYKQSDVDEEINYIINFNQRIKVNTEAKNCLSTDMGRDIDEIINAVDDVLNAEDKLQTLKDLKDNPNYSSDECQKNLDKMIEAAQKEVELLTDTLTKVFERGISNMQGHQEDIDIAVADVGNRMVRLKLTKSRLEDQKINFTNLKSENEDIELEEVVIRYASAELVYNASLTAAGKVVRQTLLDFI